MTPDQMTSAPKEAQPASSLTSESLYSLSYEQLQQTRQEGKITSRELETWSKRNRTCHKCGTEMWESRKSVPHYDSNHDYVEYVEENVPCLLCSKCRYTILLR